MGPFDFDEVRSKRATWAEDKGEEDGHVLFGPLVGKRRKERQVGSDGSDGRGERKTCCVTIARMAQKSVQYLEERRICPAHSDQMTSAIETTTSLLIGKKTIALDIWTKQGAIFA